VLEQMKARKQPRAKRGTPAELARGAHEPPEDGDPEREPPAGERAPERTDPPRGQRRRRGNRPDRHTRESPPAPRADGTARDQGGRPRDRADRTEREDAAGAQEHATRRRARTGHTGETGTTGATGHDDHPLSLAIEGGGRRGTGRRGGTARTGDTASRTSKLLRPRNTARVDLMPRRHCALAQGRPSAARHARRHTAGERTTDRPDQGTWARPGFPKTARAIELTGGALPSRGSLLSERSERCSRVNIVTFPSFFRAGM